MPATLRGETFAGRKSCEVKNLRNFRNKLLWMISSVALRENLTFANVYFRW